MQGSAAVSIFAISSSPRSTDIDPAAIVRLAVLKAALVLLKIVKLDVVQDLVAKPIVRTVRLIELHLVVLVHSLLHPGVSFDLCSE